ncbi:UDP-glucose 4-epimerase GalE [Microvirga lotononidis]|uniref:UDP-glucose 4-epimerase n=1 Tax=Microvirga lotononidis TaxID=864069 RepID=I4Z184_9HYPH|nr:UDP-glucose 4-epimerase GalE [Microvirga lotononidis]EIM29976.1 UDP-glucose-4-epimerase [Microvirga lotononidis]WQO31969.1 UDP-glucose 4-epimerase GalE [Microvirga lotononidis]
MSRTRILVTGGAGYIGSHTCKALAQNGFEPVAYDNLVAGHRDAVRWGPLVIGDVLDRQALVETMRRYDPAAVIHFAAHAYVGESVIEPAKYYRNNVHGTQTLLDACRGAGLLNVIFSSSCATYGVPEALPIREDSPQDPINPYGRSKLIGEQMLADYATAYGMRYVALRYFNACGADPGGEIGERHDPETHLIPRALMAAAGKLPHLSVFGDDYPTPDGTCIRDYIHVSDLARAHLAAVLHLLKGGENLAANLGTGRGISIKEILTAVEQVTGRRVPVRFEQRRAGDPPILFANPALARERLGFWPELSDVDTIVRSAAPFFELEARP